MLEAKRRLFLIMTLEQSSRAHGKDQSHGSPPSCYFRRRGSNRQVDFGSTVAIATAIVPPLANSGLCLALGKIRGGIGSFLLFFANFLSILVVASGTFIISGMAKQSGAQTRHIDHARRFTIPIVAFVLIAAFLSHSMVQIYQERWLTKIIRKTLIDATAKIPATYLNGVHHYIEGETVNVMAKVHSPALFTPTQVTLIQNQLTKKIGKPTKLIVNCVISNTISALGSVKHVVRPNLDGTFVAVNNDDTISDINGTYLDGKYHFLLEIVGPEIYPHKNVKTLESQLSQTYSEEIELYAWSRVEVVHGSEGQLPKTAFFQSL